MMEIRITHIDTACILLELNGYRILTDPTLDKAGGYYHHGYGAISRKTADPALDIVDLGSIDLVLLSHHQHKDNLDKRGKEVAATATVIISTPQAARAMKGIIGLEDWKSYEIKTDKVNLKITAMPCQHHPWWQPKFLSGNAIGFMIESQALTKGPIYISGDTVFFNGIAEIARRFPKIGVGIFHVGSAEFRYLSGFGRYTMNSKDLLKAVDLLKPEKIIPIHHKGWSHFMEKEEVLRSVVNNDDFAKSRTIFLTSGSPEDII